jgi:hypothetical protein
LVDHEAQTDELHGELRWSDEDNVGYNLLCSPDKYWREH